MPIEIDDSQFKRFRVEIGPRTGALLVRCDVCGAELGRWRDVVRLNDVVGSAADHDCPEEDE